MAKLETYRARIAELEIQLAEAKAGERMVFDKLLEVAKQRDSARLELDLKKDEHDALDKLVDDLGLDPNPDSEEPADVIKRHHAKAWEWASIATDAASEAHKLKAQLDAIREALE